MSNNIGARDDSAATDTTGSWSVISILKGILSGIKLKLGGSDVSSSNPLPTNAIYSAIANDGVLLPLSSLAQTNAYTNGQLATSTVVYLGNTYAQTTTWTAGNPTNFSQWVKQ